MARCDQIQRGSPCRLSAVDQKWPTRGQIDAHDPKATLALWAAMPKPILDLWLICAEMPTLHRGGRAVTVRQPQASGGF